MDKDINRWLFTYMNALLYVFSSLNRQMKYGTPVWKASNCISVFKKCNGITADFPYLSFMFYCQYASSLQV